MESVALPSLSSTPKSHVNAIDAFIALLEINTVDLSHRIGQEVVDLGGENFESLSQKIA